MTRVYLSLTNELLELLDAMADDQGVKFAPLVQSLLVSHPRVIAAAEASGVEFTERKSIGRPWPKRKPE